VTADHEVECWGANGLGQTTVPAGDWRAVSAGATHTCGIHLDWTLACWGDSAFGKTTTAAGLYSAVDAGGNNTCAIKFDGTMACFGETAAPAGTYVAVTAGARQVCGVKTDGTAACAGLNTSGQATAPAGTFTAISGGGSHTCGLKTDSTLACWGENADGQAPPSAAGTYVAVSAGDAHTCTISTAGVIACRGSNTSGQLTAPGGLHAAVTAGGGHSCAVRADSTIVCWGLSTSGQLGSADLVVSQVSDPPASVQQGASMTLTDETVNTGISPAAASVTRYYLAAAATHAAGDRLLEGSRAVPALAPGSASSGAAVATVPATVPTGSYFLVACADDAAAVVEASDVNNCTTAAAKVVVAAGAVVLPQTKPDLVVTALKNPPGSRARGKSFKVTSTTANVGTGPGVASTTRFYLSKNTTFGAGDKLLKKGVLSIPALAAGAQSAGPRTVKVPKSVAKGTYFLLACADDTKVVGEVSEANNCLASQRKIRIS